MKKSVQLLLIFLSSLGFSQSKEYETCAEAKTIAQEDFDNGLYFCKNVHYVEFASLDGDFERFYKNIIYSKYAIVIDHFDSKISEADYCYSKTMDSLVYRKFGDNVYKIVRTEAKDIYTYSDYEKSNYLDLSKTYSEVDSYPKFMGNDKIVSHYASKLFEKQKNPEFNYIRLEIGTDGKIEDFQINFDLSTDSNKSEIIESLNDLGAYIPGYLFGVKVKSFTWFYF